MSFFNKNHIPGQPPVTTTYSTSSVPAKTSSSSLTFISLLIRLIYQCLYSIYFWSRFNSSSVNSFNNNLALATFVSKSYSYSFYFSVF